MTKRSTSYFFFFLAAGLVAMALAVFPADSTMQRADSLADGRYDDTVEFISIDGVATTNDVSFSVLGGGSAPSSEEPGFSNLKVNLNLRGSPQFTVCAFYRVRFNGSSYAPPAAEDAKWVHSPENCSYESNPTQGFTAEVAASIFPTTEQDYAPGTYEVDWQILVQQINANIWWAPQAPPAYPDHSFEVAESVVAIGPSAALSAGESVTLVAAEGFAEYQWSLQSYDADACRDRPSDLTTSTSTPAATLPWPEGDDEDYRWCVRAKRSGAGGLMPYTPWVTTSLRRSDDTRNRHFGSSPLSMQIEDVNAASGNWSFERTDVALSGVAPGLEVTRVYNSQGPVPRRDAPFGRGWSIAFERQLTATVLTSGDGPVRYDYPDANEYVTTTTIQRVQLADSFGAIAGAWLTETKVLKVNGTPTSTTVSVLSEESTTNKLEQVNGLWQVTAPDGSKLLFDQYVNLAKFTDPLGRALTYDRVGGWVTGITDEVTGRTITLDWQPRGNAHRVAKVRVPSPDDSGAEVEWTYHYAGSNGERLEKVCRPLMNAESGERCEKYAWNGSGTAIASVFDADTPLSSPQPNARATYDSNLRVEIMQVWPEVGQAPNTTLFAYSGVLFDPAATTTVTDARNNAWRYSFDVNGQVTKQDAPDVNGGTGITTYEYENQRRTSVTTPSGSSPGQLNTMTFGYDDDGNHASTTDANGHSTWYHRDNRNLIESSCLHGAGPDNPDSEWCTRSEWIGYELRSRMTTLSTGQTSTEKWTYNDDGQVETHTDGENRTTVYVYYDGNEPGGAAGDLKLITYPSSLKHRFFYNAWGQRVGTFESWPGQDEYRTQGTDYNELGLPTRRLGPVTTNAITGTEHQLIEELIHNPTLTVRSVTRSDGDVSDTRRVTEYEYDRLGRETAEISPAVALVNSERARLTIRRQFDANGNVAWVDDPNGNRTSTVYDVRNRPASVTTSDTTGVVATTTTTYTDSGLIERIVDAAGRRQHFAYDAAGRQVSAFSQAGQGEPWVVDGHVIDFVDGTDWVADRGAGLTVGSGGAPGAVNGASLKQRTKTVFGPTGIELQVIEVESTGDRTTTFTYYDDAQVKTTRVGQFAASSTTSFSYDEGGYLASTIRDVGGLNLVTTTDRDPRGHVVGDIDTSGNRTDFGIDEAGRQVQQTLPAAATFGPHDSVADMQRAVSSVGYDGFGNATHERDADGYTTARTFDKVDRLLAVERSSFSQVDDSVVQPLEEFAYDANGNQRRHILTIDDDTRAVTWHEYDALNRVTLEWLPNPPDGETRPKTTYERDGVGNILKTTDPLGVVTTSTYNQWDQVTSETVTFNDDGQARPVTTRYGYDTLGNLTSTTSPKGLTTTNVYDSLSRLVETTTPGNRTTRMSYDYADRLYSTSDPRGFKTVDVYNGAGLLETTTQYGVDGTTMSQLTNDYNADGTLKSETSARDVTTFYEWDDRRQLASVSVTSVVPNIINRYGYDARGNLAWFKDANGNVTTYVANPWNQPSEVREPAVDGAVGPANRDYVTIVDAGGRTIQRLEPGQVVIDFDVDQLGRIRRESSSTGGADRTFTYDARSQLVGATSNGGPGLTFRYDDLGRLIESSGGATDSTFDYDDDGRLIVRSDSGGIGLHRYGWSDDGDLDTHYDPIVDTTSVFIRDNAGRLNRVEIGEDVEREFGYHPDGRLRSDRWLVDGARYSEREYVEYDADNNVRVEKQYQYRGPSGDANCDGAVGIGDALTVTQFAVGIRTGIDSCAGYDATRVDLSSSDVNGDGIVGIADALILTQCAVSIANENCPGGAPNRTMTYGYDLADRLVSFDVGGETTTYVYDPVGNRKSKRVDGGPLQVWNHDERNRLRTGPERVYSWTARGTLRSVNLDGQVRTYDFDGLGQMIAVDAIDYGYDALGRLATRAADGATAEFGYSGLDRDQVSDGEALYGRSPSGRLTSVDDSRGARLASVDQFGDLMHLAHADGPYVGIPAETLSFAPFGEPLVHWGATQASVGFQSDWTDPATGDVNMDARWYSSDTGTFRSRDTWLGELRSPISLNRYTYAANNPIRYWDPTGHDYEFYGDEELERVVDLVNLYVLDVLDFDVFRDRVTAAGAGFGREGLGLALGRQDEALAILNGPGVAPTQSVEFAAVQAEIVDTYSSLNDVDWLSHALVVDAIDFQIQPDGSFGEGYLRFVPHEVLYQSLACRLDTGLFCDIGLVPSLESTGPPSGTMDGLSWRGAADLVARSSLLDELATAGVKHDPSNVVRIARDGSGRVVFLETGNSRAGLAHIVEQHGDDFARRGITEAQIPDLVTDAATRGRIVGHQGRSSGRPIFEVMFDGQTHRVAVTVGYNGFIVGANPS